VKTTRKESSLAKRLAAALLFVFTLSNSQTFDLISATSTDKVAQSKFFEIDSNKVLNEYNLFAFNSPVSRIYDSVFEVAGIHAAVSAVKSSNAGSAKDFSLDQNYPNPFNPSTTIHFNVGKRAKVSVVLFDVTGKEVTTLVNDSKEAGSYNVRWNGTSGSGASVATGTYFCRMLAIADDGSSTVETKRMALVK
jgi:FlgD Ig-like domain